MALCPTNRGFTLIEVLTAILVFSLLALSCNTLFSLFQKNAHTQYVNNSTILKQQQVISIMMQDLIQAEITEQQPFELAPKQKRCSQYMAFHTNNVVNTENQFSNTSHKVVWTFTQDGVWRTTNISGSSDTQKMFDSALCFNFKIYENGQWKNKWDIDTPPFAIAFIIQLKKSYTIERIIPFRMSDSGANIK